MSQARIEALRAAIEAEKVAVMAELGLAFDGPMLVVGPGSVDEAIERRLRSVPRLLHADAIVRLRRSAMVMPWLNGRNLGGARL